MADNEPAGLPPTVDRLRELTARYDRQRTAGSDTAHEVDAIVNWAQDERAGRAPVALDADVQPVEWDEMPEKPPAREWLVDPWLPAGRLAVLSGGGGSGKSILALQLAGAVADNRTAPDMAKGVDLKSVGTWLAGPGRTVPDVGVDENDKKRAVYATYEDEADELKRRWWRIRQSRERTGVPQVNGNLIYYSLRRTGAPLWARPEDGRFDDPGAATAAGERLLAYAASVDARLLVIDASVAAYTGNENDNVSVRRFLTWLDRWAEAAGCCVLLVHHTAKYGNGPRGASDFTNGARAVLSLRYARASKGSKDAACKPQPLLTLDKANYAERDRPLDVTYWPAGEGKPPERERGQWLTWDNQGVLVAAADGTGETANGRTSDGWPKNMA